MQPCLFGSSYLLFLFRQANLLSLYLNNNLSFQKLVFMKTRIIIIPTPFPNYIVHNQFYVFIPLSHNNSFRYGQGEGRLMLQNSCGLQHIPPLFAEFIYKTLAFMKKTTSMPNFLKETLQLNFKSDDYPWKTLPNSLRYVLGTQDQLFLTLR